MMKLIKYLLELYTFRVSVSSMESVLLARGTIPIKHIHMIRICVPFGGSVVGAYH